MKTKLAVISNCDDCPHFDNEYYDYYSYCEKLERHIPWSKADATYHIPDDCPLADAPKPSPKHEV